MIHQWQLRDRLHRRCLRWQHLARPGDGCGKDWSYTLATVDNVTYQLNAKAADQAGNISAPTTNFEVKAVLF